MQFVFFGLINYKIQYVNFFTFYMADKNSTELENEHRKVHQTTLRPIHSTTI